MLTHDQTRAAMAMLGITREELASIAGVHRETISSFLHDRHPINSRTLARIEQFFKDRGLVFLEEGDPSPDGGIGLRMRSLPPKPKRQVRRAMAH